jgi:hypothetical protein
MQTLRIFRGKFSAGLLVKAPLLHQVLRIG